MASKISETFFIDPKWIKQIYALTNKRYETSMNELRAIRFAIRTLALVHEGFLGVSKNLEESLQTIDPILKRKMISHYTNYKEVFGSQGPIEEIRARISKNVAAMTLAHPDCQTLMSAFGIYVPNSLPSIRLDIMPFLFDSYLDTLVKIAVFDRKPEIKTMDIFTKHIECCKTRLHFSIHTMRDIFNCGVIDAIPFLGEIITWIEDSKIDFDELLTPEGQKKLRERDVIISHAFLCWYTMTTDIHTLAPQAPLDKAQLLSKFPHYVAEELEKGKEQNKEQATLRAIEFIKSIDAKKKRTADSLAALNKGKIVSPVSPIALTIPNQEDPTIAVAYTEAELALFARVTALMHSGLADMCTSQRDHTSVLCSLFPNLDMYNKYLDYVKLEGPRIVTMMSAIGQAFKKADINTTTVHDIVNNQARTNVVDLSNQIRDRLVGVRNQPNENKKQKTNGKFVAQMFSAMKKDFAKDVTEGIIKDPM